MTRAAFDFPCPESPPRHIDASISGRDSSSPRCVSTTGTPANPSPTPSCSSGYGLVGSIPGKFEVDGHRNGTFSTFDERVLPDDVGYKAPPVSVLPPVVVDPPPVVVPRWSCRIRR